MSGTALEWQRTRSRFSHDWLKNRFLMTVGSFLSSASGEGYPVEKALPALIEVIEQWPERRRILDRLLEEFETVMSPAELVEADPLRRVDAATREWLRAVLHLLWWKGRGNEVRRDDVRAACRQADAEYELLKKALASAASEAEIAGLEEPAKTLYSAFRGLAEAIHRLPSGIEVV